MRLIYKDPLQELAHLIELARRNPKIQAIGLTKSELKIILKHGDAARVLPRYIKSRNNMLRVVNAKITKIKETTEKEENGELSDENRIKLYSMLDDMEKQKMDIEEKVPTQIIEEGYTIKTVLK